MMLMDASHSHYTNEMRKVEADLAVAMASMTEKRQEFNQRQAQIEEIRVRFVYPVASTEMHPDDRENCNRQRKT